MSSLTEVAEAAGVSVSTASRVLTGSKHPIAAATRAKVLAAAEQLGYSPSALAQALVSRRSRLLGVLVSDIVNPYFSVIARGIDDMASRSGYVTMLSHVDRRTSTEIDRLRAMRDYSAAGVIIAGSGFVDDPEATKLAEAVAQAREQGVNMVCLAPRDLGCPTISADATAAAHEITDHLIALGHRRIAFIEGPSGMIASQQRRQGFDDCMKAAGLSDLARHQPGGFDFEAGHAATMRLIARQPLPEAILAANDEAAVGALNALRQAGIDTPGEVSVAGINDLPVAQFVGLTTVSLPLYEMGAMAARRIIEGADGGEKTTILSHRLIPRDTTARRPS
ncbi:LacI family DNA-binding transcriptional regulator [Stackebrandtia nassauensis]|uniref:Transcriptional regulator, LacI family n=1 Tax=Stackebrandtia nassauensis (strain DSM 44728 / CIP 108903 / NRRL B-16338 / NBRC 102104 / LLR-40K-21) TaxID=446470 RepID=D3PX15_STANL|nr:LacI family DNA-binding transcriptional regulator [Stackebrandtia nassauensis]ADD45239.1 transcriptional regulator, LacI family [Stackebrandtia nassauensis DSM 44728]